MGGAMSLKEQLIDLVEYMQIQMAAFPDHLTQNQLRIQGIVDAWSPKDNLFHCLYWAGQELDIAETLEKGEDWEDPENNDFEAINQEMFFIYQNKSWEDGKELSKKTYRGMVDYLERIDEDALNVIRKGRENPIWREILSLFVTHPMIHLWEQLVLSGKLDKVAEIFGDDYHKMLLNLDDSESYRGGVFYNQACLLALTGELNDAIKVLGKALKMTPALVEWSQKDTDLDALRDLPAFKALYS